MATITPQLADLIADQATLYVAGKVSSADAFARIDRAIQTGWHGNPINESRALFDKIASAVIDAMADDTEEPHVGHYSRIGGTYWCDTCNSPYCDLA
jgi:hypothetical protein